VLMEVSCFPNWGYGASCSFDTGDGSFLLRKLELRQLL